MKEPEIYEIVLKTYQLKDLLTSTGNSLSLEECRLLLKSGFCQSISRMIRNHINNSQKESKNKILDITLLSVTQNFLLSELDKFKRRLNLIEKFTCSDLISVANTGQYIIEYITSLLLFSEEIEEIIIPDEYTFEDSQEIICNIKEELLAINLPGDIESLLFTDKFPDKELQEEFKGLSTKDPAKLNLWTKNLLYLIKTRTISVSVPEEFKKFGLLMDEFIENPGKNDILLADIKYQTDNMVKSLQNISAFILRECQEDTLRDRDNSLSELLYDSFYMSFKLLFLALEEIKLFFTCKNLLNIVTGIQILSLAKSHMTLMLVRRDILFQSDNLKEAIDTFFSYYRGKRDKGKLLSFIDKELDALYLDEEKSKSVIGDYRKIYSAVENFSDEDEREKIFETFLLFLHTHNRSIKIQ